MKAKSESEVAQPGPTPSNPMDYSPPGPSIHGIFQARVLEWGAIAFSQPGLSNGHLVLIWPMGREGNLLGAPGKESLFFFKRNV